MDVVELQILHHADEAKDLELNRNLRIALSEYAPSSQVVAGGKLWTSRYLKKLPNREWPRYKYAICDHCGCYQRVLAESGERLETCEACKRPLQLELRRGPETQAVIQGPTGAEAVSVPGIVPDRYSLSLSTGRLIWEGTILPEQVLWAETYPGRDLKMAAQTVDLEQEATYLESLLGGELELRLYPGLEVGTMRIARPDRRLGTQEEA